MSTTQQTPKKDEKHPQAPANGRGRPVKMTPLEAAQNVAKKAKEYADKIAKMSPTELEKFLTDEEANKSTREPRKMFIIYAASPDPSSPVVLVVKEFKNKAEAAKFINDDPEAPKPGSYRTFYGMEIVQKTRISFR